MHLQSTHTPYSQHLRSDRYLQSCQKSVVGLFCGNSKDVRAVGYFRRRAPSLTFDGILNATLSEEKVSTTGVTQGNLKIPLPPNYLDSYQTQNNEIKSWTELTPRFHSLKGELIHWIDKAKNGSLTVGELPKVAGW